MNSIIPIRPKPAKSATQSASLASPRLLSALPVMPPRTGWLASTQLEDRLASAPLASTLLLMVPAGNPIAMRTPSALNVSRESTSASSAFPLKTESFP